MNSCGFQSGAMCSQSRAWEAVALGKPQSSQPKNKKNETGGLWLLPNQVGLLPNQVGSPPGELKKTIPVEVVSQSKLYLQQIGGREESLPKSWRPRTKGSRKFYFSWRIIFKRERWVFTSTSSVREHAST